MEEVSREFLLVHSGLKATAELQPIYERSCRVLSGPAATGSGAGGFPEGTAGNGGVSRSARLMLEWEVESQAGRALAGSRNARSPGSRPRSCLAGWPRQFPTTRPRSKSPTRPTGTTVWRLDDARAALVDRELVPIRRERLQRERDFVEALEIAPNYNATFDALSGIPLDDLVAECRAVPARYARLCGAICCRRAAQPLAGRARVRTHARRRAGLVRAPEFDQLLPGRGHGRRGRRQVAEMGIDPSAGGRVHYDTGERAGQLVPRVLRTGAGAGGGLSGHAPARRADGLSDPAARARTCAAFRVHAGRSIRSSIAGWATTR